MNTTTAQIAELARDGKAYGCRVRIGKARILRKAVRLQRLADDYAGRGQATLAAELAQSSRDQLMRASRITLPALPRWGR